MTSPLNDIEVVAIIQARMGSTRLPGKIMKPLGGDTALRRIYNRVAAAKTVDTVVVATSDNPKDRPIIELCRQEGWHCFQGSEPNVLQRVALAADAFDADLVVDITGDCPMVDPRHIDELVTKLSKWSREGFVYASNIEPRAWPDGFDVQVYTAQILYRTLRLSKGDSRINTEHTGYNILTITDSGQHIMLHPPARYWLPHWGLTLDTREDLMLLSTLHYSLDTLFGPMFTAYEAMEYLMANERLLTTNEHVKRKVPGEG